MTRDPSSPLRDLLRLALPVIGVNLGMVVMGAVDTLMVGRISAEALAAVAVANVYYATVSMFGLGILLALDPLISQALGAGDERGAIRAAQRGVALALILSLPVMAALIFTGPALTLFRQPSEVVPLAQQYALLLIPGIPFVLLFGVGRSMLQAYHRVGPVFWTIVAANLFNAGANWLLIFGHGGFPRMGVAGSAVATSISKVVMLALLLLAGRRFFTALRPQPGEAILQRTSLWEICRIGLPIAGHIQLEMGAFSAVALLMGFFGPVAMASHQIALNLASMTFMVPMGVGIAVSVLVGRASGAGDSDRARMLASRALASGAAFMTATALLFTFMPGLLAAIYTDDPAVRMLTATLLPIAGVFQIFDGLQATSVGVLRGLGDTRAPMLISLVGFVVCGLGSSWWLAWHQGFGPPGLWWGLGIGVIIVALILMLRVRVILRRPLRRISVA